MIDDTFLNKVGGDASKLENLKGYRLPKFVDVSLTVKFVEQRSNTGLSKMYDFKSIHYR